MGFDPLTERWWLTWRNDKVVQKANLRALTSTWPGLFQRGLRTRRVAGSSVQLKNVDFCIKASRFKRYRILNGLSPVSLDLLYGFASLIGIEVAEFLPRSVVEWIEGVTMAVCGGAVTKRDAQAYAHYMFCNPELQAPSPSRSGVPPSSDTVVLREVTARLRESDPSWDESNAQRAVERVAQCLRVRLAHLHHRGKAPR